MPNLSRQATFNGLAESLNSAMLAAFLCAAAPHLSRAADSHSAPGTSPVLCGSGDLREPGIQGDAPTGATGNDNCGVKLVGQLPRSGNVQGYGSCAYVWPRGQPGPQPGDQAGRVGQGGGGDPAHPIEIGSVPVHSGSESMRAVLTKDRGILVSGSSVDNVSAFA